ncbi:DivIVA domain-containing protein [Pseudoflavonifractor phocaeensis]|uniref:DivIVA domain-containing protein n=1 Tax=Pseudoflavonifractor phocaeensis TaxID=1870988 RepID=UPI0019592F9F|nr:DivIVA domain-containing protein [Pseudoflavonifractor phocaeensis]MBM6925702.1 DivIVA domain-containing protein [Pseudoflavonifractor phocaeensis]
MLTPQEVSEHAFTKAFNGYNMTMVDEFLDILTADYTSLYKENATLKAKMKVLVDKVEEYRSTEDAMRKALMTAQKMADDMVAEAESKRDQLMQNAEADAKSRMAQLQQSVRDEELRLAAAQQATASYVDKLKELYQHEMDYLTGLSKLTAPAVPVSADPVGDTARAIEENVEKLIQSEEAENAPAQPSEESSSLYAELMELSNKSEPEPQPKPQPAEEDPVLSEPTRRIDFSNLQFGKDYEIR